MSLAVLRRQQHIQTPSQLSIRTSAVDRMLHDPKDMPCRCCSPCNSPTLTGTGPVYTEPTYLLWCLSSSSSAKAKQGKAALLQAAMGSSKQCRLRGMVIAAAETAGIEEARKEAPGGDKGRVGGGECRSIAHPSRTGWLCWN